MATRGITTAEFFIVLALLFVVMAVDAHRPEWIPWPVPLFLAFCCAVASGVASWGKEAADEEKEP